MVFGMYVCMCMCKMPLTSFDLAVKESYRNDHKNRMKKGRDKGEAIKMASHICTFLLELSSYYACFNFASLFGCLLWLEVVFRQDLTV